MNQLLTEAKEAAEGAAEADVRVFAIGIGRDEGSPIPRQGGGFRRDRQGDIVSQDFTRGVIRSAERMTYTNVFRVLEGDAAMRAAMNEVLATQEWAMSAMVNVIVSDGVMHLWGVIDSKDQSHALRVAAENIPGVKSVEEHPSFSLPT